MEKLFHGSSIDSCVDSACLELDVPKDKLIYRVVEEKKGLFKKSAVIAVDLICQATSQEDHGKIEILEGKFHVTNPRNSGKPAVISPGVDVKLQVDGKIVNTTAEVFEGNEIVVEFIEELPSRTLDIKLSEDKMEAFLSLMYCPQKKYAVKDAEPQSNVIVEADIVEQIYPPHYKREEILEALKKNSIIFGIIEENLQRCLMGESIKDVLIAKGIQLIEDEPDVIVTRFDTRALERKPEEDQKGNVDFKSIGSIESVNKGEVIAQRNRGKSGQDGKDITGKVLRRKVVKNALFKPGEGCFLKDEDTIVAQIQGRPCIRNSMFFVYPVHDVRSDVDIKTGNITFVGNINIYGSVREGMEVRSENAVTITGGADRAVIVSKGDLTIAGNIINSRLDAGGEDVIKLRQINNLISLTDTIRDLIITVEEIKKFNLLGYNTSDGAAIKLLIENKFKLFPKQCLNVLTDITRENGNSNEDELAKFIRNKLVGLGPLNIKHYGELDEVLILTDARIKHLSESLSIPVTVNISYSQDSQINSSGDIYVTGLGSLVSNINSNGSIYFTGEKSIIRGGAISAKGEIKCKVVGSEAGVSTRLCVGEKGHIFADRAYQNTVFTIDNKEYRLEEPCRDIHAFIDDTGDLIVDKLKL